MHSLNFQLKRAHLKTVAFSEKLVEKVKGMTAARFDLLYLLRRVALEWKEATGLPPTVEMGMRQMDLRRRLGISRATICKMLGRLEEMRWVKREPCPDDKRTRIVKLTKTGLLRIWRAMRRVFRPKALRKKYERLFASPGAEVDVITTLMSVWGDVDRIARHFGDRSSVWYDYGQYED